MDDIKQRFLGISSNSFILMLIFIALFLILYDSSNLKKINLIKESKMATYIGVVYLILSVALFIITKTI